MMEVASVIHNAKDSVMSIVKALPERSQQRRQMAACEELQQVAMLRQAVFGRQEPHGLRIQNRHIRSSVDDPEPTAPH
jgi:hypothetical protein